MKDIIHKILKVFPNMILNEINNDFSSIPEHWKLSDIHKKNISPIIKKQYEFKKCYDKKQ